MKNAGTPSFQQERDPNKDRLVRVKLATTTLDFPHRTGTTHVDARGILLCKEGIPLSATLCGAHLDHSTNPPTLELLYQDDSFDVVPEGGCIPVRYPYLIQSEE